MTKNWKITNLIIALVLVLALGVTALAETAETPVAEQPEVNAVSGMDSAVQEALDALAAARKGNKLADLESELKAYVEAGKLTQEQSDLILKAYQDQNSLRNGTCPNCGYQFSNNGRGKGGRMKNGNMSGFDGKGGRGGHGRSNRMPNGTQQGTVPETPAFPGVSGI